MRGDFGKDKALKPGRLERALAGAMLSCTVLAGAIAGGSYAVHLKADDVLGIAASEGMTRAIKPIVWLGASRPGKDFALARAASCGKTDTVAVLLQEGADVHVGADAALIFAASKGHTGTVRLLLARGADVNAVQGTPLIAATRPCKNIRVTRGKVG